MFSLLVGMWAMSAVTALCGEVLELASLFTHILLTKFVFELMI